jgi:hypothetical protein
MKQSYKFVFYFIGIMVVFLVAFYFINPINEKMPDDVSYMLEDMYGADKNEWPAVGYTTDLNNDGFSDWVATKEDCSANKDCPAELFICVPDEKGLCSEYCYIEVKSLIDIEKNIENMKCESTC